MLGLVGGGCRQVLGIEDLTDDGGEFSTLPDATAPADASRGGTGRPDALAPRQGSADATVDQGAPTDRTDAGNARPMAPDGAPPSSVSQGDACQSDSDCVSGHCADGVCCDTACNGSCVDCNLGMLKGTCSPVPEGQAAPSSHASCTRAAATTCGQDGMCDGKGFCELWSNGTSCGAGTCDATTNMAVSGSACDGAGTCVPAKTVPCAPFKCAGSACAQTCTVDQDCVGSSCVNGSCGTVANGSVCATGGQCTSGNCVDGFCCDKPCAGQCQACDVATAAGTCTTLTSGQPHGTRTPCAGGGTSCAGACGGTATACTYPTGACAAQSCTGGTELLAASCNGAGACATQGSKSCGGYACNGTGCFSSCTTDAQCAGATPFCSPNPDAGGATCQATAPLGHACTTGTQCASGNCVDGVCCSSACGGSCEACNLGALTGICSPVAQGAASPTGHPSCTASAASTCKQDGKCDGKGNCELWANGTACMSGACSAATNMATPAGACDGAGTCKVGASQTCAPFMCSGTACATTCKVNTDCTGGALCTNGSCGPAPNGTPCTSGTQCMTGNCVDKFCCDAACGGQCQACDVAGKQGTCSAVTPGDQPHGTRTACTAGTPSCAGSCQAGSQTACSYPTTVCATQSCSNGVEQLAEMCTNGTCPPQATSTCNGFACNGTAGCFTSCNGDTQCAAPTRFCSPPSGPNGVCVSSAPPGHACKPGDGTCANCDPVSGVCCSGAAACGACQACGSLSSSSPGACLPVPDGTACVVGGSAGTCSKGSCVCPPGDTLCGGTCVDLQGNASNCGVCGNDCSQAGPSFICSAGQCTCGPNTPDGTACTKGSITQGTTCFGGQCLIQMGWFGCTSDADCVPGGCAPSLTIGAIAGVCLGSAEIPNRVTCTNPDLTCSPLVGCTPGSPPACGSISSSSARLFVQCDGPGDCGAGQDCCIAVNPGGGTQVCATQTTPGMVGSGCDTLVSATTETSASVICDPLNPTASCPAGTSCIAESQGGFGGFVCQLIP